MHAFQLNAARSRRRLHRLSPGVESLEGRQLLATIATTLDVNNNPIVFTIGSGGVVQDDRQVATNNSSSPYRSNGLESLPGITATSIAAYQLPNGNPVVLATVGPESFVYLKEYEATNDPAMPYEWTSWIQSSQFVAKSIIAVSATGGSGPAIFAIGANNNVYENLYVGGSGSGGAYTDFQEIPGLRGASLAAIYDSSGTNPDTYQVFALLSSQSYVYQATTSYTNNAISSTAWTTQADFVANSLSVATGPTAAISGASSPNSLMLFVTGAGDGYLYDQSYVLNTQTGERTAGGFDKVNVLYYVPAGQSSSSSNSIPLPLVATSAVDSGEYVTVFALGSNGNVYENQYILTGLNSPSSYWVGWQRIPAVDSTGEYSFLSGSTEVASSITSSGGLELVTKQTNGDTFFTTAPAHDALAFPGYTPIVNDFALAADLSASGTHPLVTTTGVNGRPVVFTIGDGGTVYVSQDEATGSGVTTTQDSYSAFTQIPGLLTSVTSIAATTEPDGIAVFALNANVGLIYEAQYRPTGTGSYAWTGWQAMGDFVASSIAAATGGDSASNGPTVFAIGTDRQVYSASSTAPSTSSNPYTFGTFTALTGLKASTISVTSTNTGLEVAALIGPESYSYANLEISGTWTGWQLTGDYVMSTVVASNSATGGPAIFGISPLSYEANSTYGTSGWGAYVPTNFMPFAREIQDGQSQYTGFAAVTLPDQVGVIYYDLLSFLPTNTYLDGAYTAYSFADGGTAVGQSPINNMPGNSLAAAPNGLQPTYYIVGQDGNIYVNQAVPLAIPGGGFGDTPRYGYLGYVSLGAVPQ